MNNFFVQDIFLFCSGNTLRLSFFKGGPFPASFSLFLYFLQLVDKILPMLGFELRISGIGCDRSTNRATTTATHWLS